MHSRKISSKPHSISRSRRHVSTLIRSRRSPPQTVTRPSHRVGSKSAYQFTLPASLPMTTYIYQIKPLYHSKLSFSSINTPKTSSKSIQDLFSQLHAGLGPMLPDNPGMTITVPTNDSMEVFIPGFNGSYFFQPDQNPRPKLASNPRAAEPLITMISPHSGAVYSYYHDDQREAWVCVDDEHFLQELLTRELLKTCYGYPQF